MCEGWEGEGYVGKDGEGVGSGEEGRGGMNTHTSSIFGQALLKIAHKLYIATFR